MTKVYLNLDLDSVREKSSINDKESCREKTVLYVCGN